MIAAMESEARRPKDALLTAENRDESAALKKLWTAYKDSSESLTQEAFGQKFGIGNQGAVWQCLNAKGMPISLKAAQGFAEGLRCQIEDFSPRLAKLAKGIADSVGQPIDDFVEVKRISAVVSAGPGATEGIYEEVGSLAFRREFLSNCGVTPGAARILNVKGTSMEPTIPDGSVLLVNTANKEPRSGAIYALARGDELLVKRLVSSGDMWLARSDNQDGNPDFQINDGEVIVILGRAVWIGAKL